MRFANLSKRTWGLADVLFWLSMNGEAAFSVSGTSQSVISGAKDVLFMSLCKWRQWRGLLLLQLLATAFGRVSHSQSKPPLPDPLRTSVIDQMFNQEFTKDKAGALTVGLIKEGR